MKRGSMKLSKKVILNSAFICMLVGSSFAHADSAVSTPVVKPKEPLEKQIKKAEQKTNKKKLVTFTLENDLFGSGDDQNYTNGFRFSYMDIDAKIPDFILDVAQMTPYLNFGETSGIYYSFGQNLYTPSNIKLDNPPQDDRPYAAWLYVSAGLATAKDNRVDEFEVSVGMVGPAALGEDVQKTVHKNIGADNPKGWHTQLNNEPGIILSAQRTWPSTFDYSLLGLTMRASPHAGVTLGNIYTYANAGATVSLMPYWQTAQANPLRVRPSIPGSGYFGVTEKRFGWYLFAGFDGRAVGRNIFLDGNSFENSRSVDKKYFVGDMSLGAAMTYEDLRLSYTVTYRSKEFHNQNESQIFGSISLSQRF